MTPSRKRKRTEDEYFTTASSALEKIGKALEQPPQQQQHDVFNSSEAIGKLITSKLKEVEDPQKRNKIEETLILTLYRCMTE